MEKNYILINHMKTIININLPLLIETKITLINDSHYLQIPQGHPK